jgi:lipoprotein-anchoring transpeptidase ErfK/SrfK
MDDRIVKQHLRRGLRAARAGDMAQAREAFSAAHREDPSNETALLWTGYLAENPDASLEYISQAIAKNVQSTQAYSALKWAWQRAATTEREPALTVSPPPTQPSRTPRLTRQSMARLAFLVGMVLVGVSVGWTVAVTVPPDAAVAAQLPESELTAEAIAQITPTPADTPTPKPTALPATSTPLPPPPTDTPLPTPTPTPTPTPSFSLTPTPIPPPAEVSEINEDRWIDVDLSDQTLIAYQGQTPIRRFLVSTGRQWTPTPTGQFRVYVKFVSDDMQGADYYLPDVPYVMYFYRGYGIHGTFWHENFGHPMSHGCVNLPPSDAEWLFNWASVGSLVNIHN